MLRAFEFRVPVVGYGKDVDEAFSQAIANLANDADDAVRGDIGYKEITESDYAEELVRAMEVTGMSVVTSGDA